MGEIAGAFIKPVAVVAGIAVGAGAVVVGVGALVGGIFGEGALECIKATVTVDLGKIGANCINYHPNHGDGVANITGPKKLAETATGTTLTMTFGDVEETVVYPRNKDGKLTKIDWDGGTPDFGQVTGTRFVDDTPFALDYTPCVKLGDDYQKIKVDIQSGATDSSATTVPGAPTTGDTSKESELQVSFGKNDLTDPDLVTDINVSSGPITACDIRLPAKDKDGKDNTIHRHNDNAVNNGLEQTFDFVTYDLALQFGQAAACPEKYVNTDAVKNNIGKYVLGAVIESQPGLALAKNINMNIQLGDPVPAKQYFTQQLQESITKYTQLNRSIFKDTDGHQHGLKVQFSDQTDMLKSMSC